MVKGTIKVLIAAGGTGGHLFPGIAIAEEIRRAHPDARITFAGTERGFEAALLPRMGWPVILIGSRSIKDRKGAARIAAWARLPFSVAHALAILIKDRPALLVCIGGYAAGPLALASWLLRVPFAIVEPNAIAGFTNRILGRLARRAFVAFDEAAPYFPKGKAVLSGNPVRSEVLAVRSGGMVRRDRLNIFVFGGSQGALKLNRAMTDAMKLLGGTGERIRVMHQTGSNDDPKAIEGAYADAGVEAKVFAFSDRIWECYADADLVISRAGATTIAELAALEIPSLLVPYPYAADDHQRANAGGIARLGGAVMIDDAECTGERLAEEIRGFALHPERLLAMRGALAKAGRPEAARVIVEESWKLIRI